MYFNNIHRKRDNVYIFLSNLITKTQYKQSIYTQKAQNPSHTLSKRLALLVMKLKKRIILYYIVLNEDVPEIDSEVAIKTHT